VPARRKFLKSDSVEFKHVVSEFIRVALTRPEVGFTLTHNGKEVYVLRPAKSLKFRIQDVLGATVANEVVDVYAETSVVTISGYVGRPTSARKALGNQYLFVNGRFFKSPYLHKAVMKAYENLIPDGVTPSYFLYLQIDPQAIDVNIHPTKTEIKFEDDSVIFQIVYACITEALGKNSFGESIDFDREGVPDIPAFSQNFGLASIVALVSAAVRKWGFAVAGFFCSLVAMLILSYYAVIGGWILIYSWESFSGGLCPRGAGASASARRGRPRWGMPIRESWAVTAPGIWGTPGRSRSA
jgi:hypothetical protein